MFNINSTTLWIVDQLQSVAVHFGSDLFVFLFIHGSLPKILFYQIPSVMSRCEECREKEKQFRVLEADLLFEIKKMKEDLAQEKVTLQLQFQKESKKVLEKYQKQKMEREDDNHNWIEKYDRVIGEHQQKIREVQSFYQQKQKELQDGIKLKYSERERQREQQHKNTVDQLTNNCNRSIEEMREAFKEQLHSLKKCHQQAIRKITCQNQNQMKDVKFNYQSSIASLEKQIADAKESFNKLQLEDYRKQTALYQDLEHKRNYINHIRSQIDQLEQTLTSKEIQLKLNTKHIESLAQQHLSTIATMQKDFQAQKKNILNQTNNQIQNILKEKLEHCQKLGLVVKTIEEKRESQIKIYEINMREVKELVEDRPSRQEDVKKINELREQLVLKQKEFQKAYQEAKYYRLQLKNKEETYCKIFAAYTSPLNIQRISKPKQMKKSRATITMMRDVTSKYNSTSNMYAFTSTSDLRREKKLNSSKSTKLFNFS